MDIDEILLGQLISTADLRTGDVVGNLTVSETIATGDVVDVLRDLTTGGVRIRVHRPRPLLDMAAMVWTCMVCHEERPDAFISVAHRQIAGLEHMFPDGARVNVRYCNDRPSCSATAREQGVWPPVVAEPVPDDPQCDLAAGVHITPHRGCVFH